MSPAVFSPLVPRHCRWCQEPLQGRSDKQFCSPACRAMAKRHGVGEEGPIDWAARAAAAEQTVRALEAHLAQQAHAQQAALAFEQEYDHLVRLLGQAMGDVERVGTVASYLTFVDGLLLRYQQHPGLVSGERYPQQRLVLLQELRAQMAAHQALLQQREAYLAHQRRQQGAADEAGQQAPQNASAPPQAIPVS